MSNTIKTEPVRKRRHTPITRREEQAFLDCLMDWPQITDAAAAVGRPRGTFYRRRKQNPEFAAEWELAIEIGLAHVEALVLDWAANGFEVVEVKERDGVEIETITKRIIDPKFTLRVLELRHPAW